MMFGMAVTQPTQAQEPTCDQDYIVRSGDSLSRISRVAFGDANYWPLIYYTNSEVIGEDPSILAIGAPLRMPPCPNEANTGNTVTDDAAEVSQSSRPANTIEILTGSDYSPFTDHELDQGGMLTELVTSVLSTGKGNQAHVIDWVDDWDAHIDPLLRHRKYDMGFPWFKPDCTQPDNLPEDDRLRCEFLFSEPLFDLLIVLFKRVEDTSPLTSDTDLHGKRLCRPSGYFTFDLAARGLVPGGTIELDRPQSVDECFHRLIDGQVDFVTLNQLTGQEALNQLDYSDYVTVSEDLADVLSLHLITHKTHPNASILMHHFNRGLKEVKSNGVYDELVSRHLAKFHGL